ncbi:glycosyltransferase family 4 protein [Vallitalea okinawensis]|uniref:glycosyltransferase family 4 protein n=1 Tax=Vallitalea okinawensis TaxID=2078660 RepID=UPI000CFAB626|nr:glycosyltransferase family 4 protein [Vallitalea okinawensis]
MRVLVTTADYPDNNGKVTLMYIHTRNIYYLEHGIDVTVLSFRAIEDYVIEGIKVIGLESYKKYKEDYDVLILHATNIRNHFIFLKLYGNHFRKFIFFYHGHEVLRCNMVYSKPYSYVRKSKIKAFVQNVYDSFKLSVWRYYLPSIEEKSYFVFVSNWMKEEFLKWTKIEPEVLNGRSSITYNSIGKDFENLVFMPKGEKKYDFVTIRSNIDGSKYSIDVVNQIAKNTPEKKFLVIGKGKFFSHYEKAANLDWENKTLSHKEIVDILQASRFALMPTRTDAQGLMMCEMAAFGIPLITSDIPVCHEIFGAFDNVYYINNDDDNNSLSDFTPDKSRCIKHKKYYKDNTVQDEVRLIERVMKS